MSICKALGCLKERLMKVNRDNVQFSNDRIALNSPAYNESVLCFLIELQPF